MSLSADNGQRQGGANRPKCNVNTRLGFPSQRREITFVKHGRGLTAAWSWEAIAQASQSAAGFGPNTPQD